MWLSFVAQLRKRNEKQQEVRGQDMDQQRRVRGKRVPRRVHDQEPGHERDADDERERVVLEPAEWAGSPRCGTDRHDRQRGGDHGQGKARSDDVGQRRPGEADPAPPQSDVARGTRITPTWKTSVVRL